MKCAADFARPRSFASAERPGESRTQARQGSQRFCTASRGAQDEIAWEHLRHGWRSLHVRSNDRRPCARRALKRLRRVPGQANQLPAVISVCHARETVAQVIDGAAAGLEDKQHSNNTQARAARKDRPCHVVRTIVGSDKANDVHCRKSSEKGTTWKSQFVLPNIMIHLKNNRKMSLEHLSFIPILAKVP